MKMDGWKLEDDPFLLESFIFRGYVSLKKDNYKKVTN